MTPKVIVTQPVHAQVRTRLEAVARLEANPGPEPWTAEQLARHAADADGLIGFMTDRVDASLLAAAPRLRIVACALKGFDSYDVAACTAAGLWVSIVPDLLTEPTAELAIGLAIGAARHVRVGDEIVRGGGFEGWRPRLYGRGLQDAVVAVVGLGRVGMAIVQRLAGFGCSRIVGVDPSAAPAGVTLLPLFDALAEADFVFVAAPLVAGSRHAIGAAALAQALRQPVIVNVGRGSVVDEEAMADALEDGHIAAYAADVFAFEDWSLADRPRKVPRRLREHPATLFTPHLGSAVQRVRLAIEQRAADNVLAVLSGTRPPDAINEPLSSIASHPQWTLNGLASHDLPSASASSR
jgi:phosphonate dehydrogenase